MLILEDIDGNTSCMVEDTTFFVTHYQARNTCAFAVVLNCLGILFSGLICSIIILKGLWHDQLYIFMLCYFGSELIHVMAYMFSISTACFMDVTFAEHICSIIEIILLWSGLLSLLWLSFNAIIRCIYFMYPFKYARLCTLRNCIITIFTVIVAMLSLILVMGGYPHRRPIFTNSCRSNNKSKNGVFRVFQILMLRFSIFIQIYCPYRLWKLIKSQVASQNALCLPANVANLMQIPKQKSFRMLLVISGGFWIFFIPMVIADITTSGYILVRFQDETPHNRMSKESVIYSVWPLVNSFVQIVQHTLRSVMTALCTLVSCPPISSGFIALKNRIINPNFWFVYWAIFVSPLPLMT